MNLKISLVLLLLLTSFRTIACKGVKVVIDNEVEFSVYENKNYSRTILIIPPTYGENFLDRGLAKYICKFKGRAIVVQSWKNYDEPMSVIDLKRHDRLTAAAMKALKRVIDWSGSSKVGVVGASLGGVYSSYLSFIDQRVTSAVIVAAGGPSSEVLALGDQDILNQLRDSRFRYFNYYSKNDYMNDLEKKLEFDTLKMASPKLGRKMSFIILTKDKTMLTKTQRQLYKSWGGKGVKLEINSGHTVGIGKAYLLKRRWIKEQLFSRL